jgi:hypothetical protein
MIPGLRRRWSRRRIVPERKAGGLVGQVSSEHQSLLTEDARVLSQEGGLVIDRARLSPAAL